jgi:transglutaminase-like putative cysteine protease
MNFAIRYLSTYAYDGDVVDNLNALRVKPATTPSQRVEEFSVRLSPEARQHRHTDYFGTEVVEFEITRPHRELAIDVRARVATAAPPAPPRPDWAGLAVPRYRETAGEFLLQTDDAPGHPVLEELRERLRSFPDPMALIAGLLQLIPDRFEYRRGATYVDSTLLDVLDGGAGVCQDFVHLGLNLLRGSGIAARYVSGYLFSAVAGEDLESVEVDTHAWIEAMLPAGEGDPVWLGIDPTNRGLVAERHVKIGHGRHYADVPPIKGVYRGVANATLRASVTMTRMEGVDPGGGTRG